MNDMNRVFLTGNLVKLPELRYTPSGAAVTTLRLASNEEWTDKNTGQKKERSLFIDCHVFGKSAESAKQYVTVIGTKLLIEGRIQSEEWTAKDGTKRFDKSINVDRWQFMGSKKEREDAPAAAPEPTEPEPTKAKEGWPF